MMSSTHPRQQEVSESNILQNRLLAILQKWVGILIQGQWLLCFWLVQHMQAAVWAACRVRSESESMQCRLGVSRSCVMRWTVGCSNVRPNTACLEERSLQQLCHELQHIHHLCVASGDGSNRS